MVKPKNLAFNVGAVALAIIIVAGVVYFRSSRRETNRGVFFAQEEVRPTPTKELLPEVREESLPAIFPTPTPGPRALAEPPAPRTRFQEMMKKEQKQLTEQVKAEWADRREEFVRVLEDQMPQIRAFYLEQTGPLLAAARQGDVSKQLWLMKNRVEAFRSQRPKMGEGDRLKAKEIDELTWEMYHRIMEMAVSGEFSGPDSEALLKKTIQEELDRMTEALNIIRYIK
jgi:hypothetical protein